MVKFTVVIKQCSVQVTVQLQGVQLSNRSFHYRTVLFLSHSPSLKNCTLFSSMDQYLNPFKSPQVSTDLLLVNNNDIFNVNNFSILFSG